MDIWLLVAGDFTRISFDVIIYSLVTLTLYYYALKPLSSLLFHVYYAHRFHYIPSHPIYGHLKYLMPKFPNPNYDLSQSTKNFYRIMMESNDPVTGSNISIMWIGWLPVYLVSGASVVEAVLNKSNVRKPHFYKLIGLRDGLITSDPEKWRQRRKMIEPFFKTKQYSYFISVMNREISAIPDQMASKVGVPCDIESLIHRSALNIILEIAWGIPCEDLQDMKVIWLDVLEKAEVYFIQRIYNPLFWYDGIFRLFEAGKKYYNNVNKVAEGIDLANSRVKDYKKPEGHETINNNEPSCGNVEDDSMFSFLSKNGNGKVKMDLEGISEELLNMVAAGHETTSIGMRWTLFILGNHPEIQDRLYKEIIEVFPDDSPVDDLEKISACTYLDQCLKESLRLNPPIHAVARQLSEDVMANGQKLHKNSVVILNFSATHHDATIYPNPKKYDPDRWSKDKESSLPRGAFLAFSIGPRNCIGYRYAQIEMKIYLIHILRRYKFKSLLKPEDITYRFEISLKPDRPLETIFTPRA